MVLRYQPAKPVGAGCLAIAAAVHADPGGAAFRIPGPYASLAAVPPMAGGPEDLSTHG